ncbi:SAM-dependent methyltransferase [Xylanibacillus composti]|uniref:SAM-dependent methyltransferase n=1 Tax=Xylanibacillus composti TaxID=1572762 RepID=A0A8J4M1M4_9BACL|nr:SAM-dependent methyltransferase [Xylanibacillus composti]
MADIGSDHALLPVYLIQAGKAARAVAGEVNTGPFRAAKRQVESAGLASQIDVRLGDGLQVVQPGEVDAVAIAGMGGGLIRDILHAGRDRLSGVKRLVLQPNVGEELVRYWLAENGWFLSAERILEEDGLTYEILTADRVEQAAEKNLALYAKREVGGRTISSSALYKLGPYLLEERSGAYMAKWQRELAKRKAVVKQMERAASPEAAERKERLLKEIDELEEALSC